MEDFRPATARARKLYLAAVSDPLESELDDLLSELTALARRADAVAHQLPASALGKLLAVNGLAGDARLALTSMSWPIGQGVSVIRSMVPMTTKRAHEIARRYPATSDNDE